jgi:hypothetical protein
MSKWTLLTDRPFLGFGHHFYELADDQIVTLIQVVKDFWSIYLQCNASWSQTLVSSASPAESLSLLTKWAGYLRLRQASAIFVQTDRDDRLTWSTIEYFSRAGTSL